MKDFDIFEFIWRTAILLVLVGVSLINLVAGFMQGNGGAVVVGLVVGVPAFFWFMSWLDRFKK